MTSINYIEMADGDRIEIFTKGICVNFPLSRVSELDLDPRPQVKWCDIQVEHYLKIELRDLDLGNGRPGTYNALLKIKEQLKKRGRLAEPHCITAMHLYSVIDSFLDDILRR